MADEFSTLSDSTIQPARNASTITPHATDPLTNIPKAVYVGGAGDITMRGVDDSADSVWKNVPAGTILPFRPQYVRVSGTTATYLLGLY